MASELIAAKDIPSVSTLYRSGQLRPSSRQYLPKANQQYNDKVCMIQADITKLQVDAIVNAANRRLRGGGGVDGAIHKAAGPGLLRECAILGGCETGSAKITDAYNLPCKKVIHAVGPIFHGVNECEPLLRNCYRKALSLAVENNCKTVAFPAISTGVYGYPSEDAARTAIREVYSFLPTPEAQKIDKIIFCNFLDKDMEAYANILPTILTPTKDDLSHTGEYKVSGNIQPKDQMPTATQTRPRAVYKSPDEPEAVVASTPNFKSFPSFPSVPSTPDSNMATDGSASEREWSMDGETGGKTDQYGGGDRQDNGLIVDGKATGAIAAAATETKSRNDTVTVAVAVADDDNEADDEADDQPVPCTHLDYFKCLAPWSHGLWPHSALVCPCGAKVFQARTTYEPAIGRGDYFRF